MVSCHNDSKPEKLIFDGHRVWLVDWEAAFVNDRYFDLAIIANFVVTSDAEEQAYLHEYFGQPPVEYLARFFLMRQVMHMLCATFFLLLGSAGKPVDLREKLPSFRDFHQRIWAGKMVDSPGGQARISAETGSSGLAALFSTRSENRHVESRRFRLANRSAKWKWSFVQVVRTA